MTEQPTQIENEQRRIAELLHSFDAPAPESLHRRIETLVATHQDDRFAWRSFTRPRSPVRLFSAAAVTVAVVAIAIAVALGGGSAPALSLRQAAAPTLREATLPAPPESSTHRAQLTAAVNGVPFPYWEDRFGWHSSGSRTDHIGGRSITTVFYTDSAGRRVGYAILAGASAPRLNGGVIAWRGGISYRLLTENGAAAIAWLREGHLCVISGHGVSSATLLRLASWSDHAATIS
jgi:hypothetical protein